RPQPCGPPYPLEERLDPRRRLRSIQDPVRADREEEAAVHALDPEPVALELTGEVGRGNRGVAAVRALRDPADAALPDRLDAGEAVRRWEVHDQHVPRDPAQLAHGAAPVRQVHEQARCDGARKGAVAEPERVGVRDNEGAGRLRAPRLLLRDREHLEREVRGDNAPPRPRERDGQLAGPRAGVQDRAVVPIEQGEVEGDLALLEPPAEAAAEAVRVVLAGVLRLPVLRGRAGERHGRLRSAASDVRAAPGEPGPSADPGAPTRRPPPSAGIGICARKDSSRAMYASGP